MKERVCYKVGGHVFALSMTQVAREALQLTAFDPFVIDTIDETLFEAEVVDTISEPIVEPILVDAPQNTEGMPKVDIYRTAVGLMYKITMPYSDDVNATLLIDESRCVAQIALKGKLTYVINGINNALILTYITFTMKYNTLLLHASTVMYKGVAYLFLGKSGTGKSTHSRMWLESFEDAELLNDDHPIVRAFDDGTVTVYGSPWSGKTPCYKNLSAPMGGVVRIERALSNSIERLRPLKAYASITTSCSGVQWHQQLLNQKVNAVEAVVKGSKIYTIHCLPNHDAAQLCYKFISEDI